MRELGDNSPSENSSITKTFDNILNIKTKDIYARRISQKPVTGVNFYRKDVKSKEISKRLAFRRIKMI
jgi:Asp-tRNA(Asn)/Glu-tRNA(Gln) amidotransferase C subunit